jgi:hypothetical protein
MSFSNGGFNKKNYNDIDIQKNISYYNSLKTGILKSEMI